VWLHTRRHLPSVSFFCACSSSSTSKYYLYISWKRSWSTVTKSIQYDQWSPMAASMHMSSEYLQPPSASTGVHLQAVSNSSAPRSCHDTLSPESQLPILASTCWKHCSWPTSSMWQIAPRRIQLALGWLWLCPLHHPSMTNHHLHHLHHVCGRTVWAIRANPQSLQY